MLMLEASFILLSTARDLSMTTVAKEASKYQEVPKYQEDALS